MVAIDGGWGYVSFLHDLSNRLISLCRNTSSRLSSLSLRQILPSAADVTSLRLGSSLISLDVFCFLSGPFIDSCVLRTTCLSLPLHTTAVTAAHLPARTRPFIAASLHHNGPEVTELPQNQFNFSQPCPPS